jgi:hypothetical protein
MALSTEGSIEFLICIARLAHASALTRTQNGMLI